MADPSWAPQNQPQFAVGETATNVGRDQNIHNTYTHLSDNGMTLTYEAFKKAIAVEVAIEVDKVRRNTDQRLAEIEHHYHSELAKALSDFDQISAQRDLAIEERDLAARRAQQISQGGLLDRVTGGALAASAIALILLGSVFGHLLSGSNQEDDPLVSTAELAVATSANEVHTETVTLTESARPEAIPAHPVSDEPLRCDGDHFIIRLEVVAPGPLRDVTVFALATEYRDRLRGTGLNIPVYETLTNGSCKEEDRARLADHGFVWAGPFSDREEAKAICKKFRDAAVSEDCYVTSG